MDQIDYIELPAENIADLIKTKAFFETVFGWEFQQWGDDYADTKSSGVGSGINAESPSKAPLPVIHVADIEAAISARLAARKARNFAEADRIREALKEKGILLEDSASGTTWRRA